MTQGNKQIVIFVNGKKKDRSDGVTEQMSVDAIAGLVGLTAANATVRREQGESGKVGDPLSGTIDIKDGEHFTVTRNSVDGGCR
jgi:hypothetical protein